MAILLNNKILDATQDQVEATLTPDIKDDYIKVVASGMKLALDKGGAGLMGRVKASKDPVAEVARGAVTIAIGLRMHSKNTMPLRAMVPGAMTLMLQGLDILDKSKRVPIGAEELNRATAIFGTQLMKYAKVTPKMLNHAAGVVNGIIQDPDKMEKIKLKAGLVKDPRAPTPTLAPEKGVSDGV